MDTKTTISVILKEESDELIFLMMVDDDESVKREGQQEFYSRYDKHIFNTCLRLCKYHPDPHRDAEDLTIEVLLKIFGKAASFVPQNSSNPEENSNITKAWINTVATNLYHDIKAVELDEKDAVEKYIESECEGEMPIIPSKFAQAAKECLATLSEKQRDIIRAYYAEKDPSNNDVRGRDGVTQTLADEYKTTQPNIRKIVSRAKKAIKNCIIKSGIN